MFTSPTTAHSRQECKATFPTYLQSLRDLFKNEVDIAKKVAFLLRGARYDVDKADLTQLYREAFFFALKNGDDELLHDLLHIKNGVAPDPAWTDKRGKCLLQAAKKSPSEACKQAILRLFPNS